MVRYRNNFWWQWLEKEQCSINVTMFTPVRVLLFAQIPEWYMKFCISYYTCLVGKCRKVYIICRLISRPQQVADHTLYYDADYLSKWLLSNAPHLLSHHLHPNGNGTQNSPCGESLLQASYLKIGKDSHPSPYSEGDFHRAEKNGKTPSFLYNRTRIKENRHVLEKLCLCHLKPLSRWEETFSIFNYRN